MCTSAIWVRYCLMMPSRAYAVLRAQKGEVMHFKYIMQMLAEFRGLIKTYKDNVSRITVPKGGKVLVVGALQQLPCDARRRVHGCNGHSFEFRRVSRLNR